MKVLAIDRLICIRDLQHSSKISNAVIKQDVEYDEKADAYDRVLELTNSQVAQLMLALHKADNRLI